MRIGFGAIPDGSVDATVELVKLGERLGYDSAWVPDQTFHRDPFVMLARCAVATSRIRLVLGVTSPFTRHPIQVARSIATVAELAPGRVTLGYGVGNVRQLVSRLGGSSRGASTCMVEAVEVTRRALAGETVTLAGEHFTVDGVALEMNGPADVPIHVAGRGPRMLELAGSVADGVIIGSLVSPQAIEWALGRVDRGIDARSGEIGDRPELVSWASAFIEGGPDDPDVALRPMVAHVVAGAPSAVLEGLGIAHREVQALRKALERGDEGAAVAAVTPPMLNTFALVGTPDEVESTIQHLSNRGFSELGVLLQQPSFSERVGFLRRFAEVAGLV